MTLNDSNLEALNGEQKLLTQGLHAACLPSAGYVHEMHHAVGWPTLSTACMAAP